MTLSHENIEVGSSDPQILTIPPTDERSYSSLLSISVQNLDTVYPVYLGSKTVTPSSYGFRLNPGQTFSADLTPNEELYGITASSSIGVAVIRLER